MAESIEAEYTEPRLKNGRYENPWKDFKFPNAGKLLKFLFGSRDYSNVPNERVSLELLSV